MDLFSALNLIGGLAMFLYGMEVMGDGLKKLSGNKLEMILSKLTSNRFKGFLLGLIVTSLIQSSSATTVMLIGFVNSGLMKLGQTISVIMGARIGTTVTGWLLSLSGISGDSLFVKLFMPSTFTPILAAIGIILTMANKSDSQKYIGSILLGFSILIFGMQNMSGAVEGLKDSPTFTRMLVMFSNPIMGIIAGLALTAIIQSSSASVGILQALSASGTITFSTAFPIILGQNIGDVVTPIISSISGNTDAKRVAVSSLYIKIISVVIVATVFYALNAILKFTFMGNVVNTVQIAIIHTIFNIVSNIILMPFCGGIEKLARLTIKEKEEERKHEVFDALDERFLSIPAFAVDKCHELVAMMAKLSEKSVEDAFSLLDGYDKKKHSEITKNEGKVDIYEDKLSTYLVHLAGCELSDKKNREVTELLHVIGDAERISDHAVNIAEAAQEICEKNICFSDEAMQEIMVIKNAVCEILNLAVKALTENDNETAKLVEPLEQIIDKLKHRIKSNHIKRLRDGNCTVEMGFVLSDLLTNCERISDHCSNIAVCLLETANNSFEMHEYLNHVKNDGENDFFEVYESYKKKYNIKKFVE